jgi:hypothetical protein
MAETRAVTTDGADDSAGGKSMESKRMILLKKGS